MTNLSRCAHVLRGACNRRVLLAVLRFGALFFRSSETIRAENLVLHKQIARFVEREIKPRRVDHATRVSLALFTRLFDWRDAVVNVRPATIVRQAP